jgi:2-keto-3-deoxy-L-rhamnonate aldolase RhmA
MHGIESLKSRIQSGETIVGASIRMWATKADIEHTMSLRNYDYLSVDAQHSPFSEENLANVSEIANEMGIPIQLRIKHTQFTFTIGNMLDLGPSMIEVPQVEDLNTVHDAVANFNYPQKGKRSWGPSRSPQIAEKWHKPELTYSPGDPTTSPSTAKPIPITSSNPTMTASTTFCKNSKAPKQSSASAPTATNN